MSATEIAMRAKHATSSLESRKDEWITRGVYYVCSLACTGQLRPGHTLMTAYYSTPLPHSPSSFLPALGDFPIFAVGGNLQHSDLFGRREKKAPLHILLQGRNRGIALFHKSCVPLGESESIPARHGDGIASGQKSRAEPKQGFTERVLWLID